MQAAWLAETITYQKDRREREYDATPQMADRSFFQRPVNTFDEIDASDDIH